MRNPNQAPKGCLSSFADDDVKRRLSKAGTIVEVFRKHHSGSGSHPLRLLDIGAGSGTIGQAVAAELNARCIHVDTSNQLSGNHGFLVLASGEHLPFQAGSLDLVIANHVIEHLPNQEAFLREVSRVLKGNGVCYLATPNKYGVLEPHYKIPFLSWLPQALADQLVQRMGLDSHFAVQPVSRAKLRCLARAAGLDATDLTVEVISAPADFRRRGLLARLGSLLPRTVVKLLLPASPTFIWLLRPVGDSQVWQKDRAVGTGQHTR